MSVTDSMMCQPQVIGILSARMNYRMNYTTRNEKKENLPTSPSPSTMLSSRLHKRRLTEAPAMTQNALSHKKRNTISPSITLVHTPTYPGSAPTHPWTRGQVTQQEQTQGLLTDETGTATHDTDMERRNYDVEPNPDTLVVSSTSEYSYFCTSGASNLVPTTLGTRRPLDPRIRRGYNLVTLTQVSTVFNSAFVHDMHNDVQLSQDTPSDTLRHTTLLHMYFVLEYSESLEC
jgi:hypothetical protein